MDDRLLIHVICPECGQQVILLPWTMTVPPHYGAPFYFCPMSGVWLVLLLPIPQP